MEKKIIKRKTIEGMNREEKWICFQKNVENRDLKKENGMIKNQP